MIAGLDGYRKVDSIFQVNRLLSDKRDARITKTGEFLSWFNHEFDNSLWTLIRPLVKWYMQVIASMLNGL